MFKTPSHQQQWGRQNIELKRTEPQPKKTVSARPLPCRIWRPCRAKWKKAKNGSRASILRICSPVSVRTCERCKSARWPLSVGDLVCINLDRVTGSANIEFHSRAIPQVIKNHPSETNFANPEGHSYSRPRNALMTTTSADDQVRAVGTGRNFTAPTPPTCPREKNAVGNRRRESAARAHQGGARRAST